MPTKIIRTYDLTFPSDEVIDQDYRGKTVTVVCSYQISDFDSIIADGAELTGGTRRYASEQLQKAIHHNRIAFSRLGGPPNLSPTAPVLTENYICG